jgi:hypothetical protein
VLLISFVRIYQFYNTFSAINDRIEYNNYDNLKKMVIFACMIAVENEQKQISIVHRDYEVSDISYLLRN